VEEDGGLYRGPGSGPLFLSTCNFWTNPGMADNFQKVLIKFESDNSYNRL